MRRAASQRVERVKFPGSKASLTLNLSRLVSQRVSKPCWTPTAQNSPSAGPSCQSAHRQTGDVCFTTLRSVSSLLFYFSDESREASRTVLRQRAACSVRRYIHWKGFPSLRPPYPSWSALKNNTPAVHTRRFVSATAALEIANFPHQRLAAILHICPSLLNLFSPRRRLKCSRTIGEGAANDKVHYGSMMAFNMGDVLLFPSHWANLRKCTEGKKKSLWATLWWQDL